MYYFDTVSSERVFSISGVLQIKLVPIIITPVR